MNLRGLLHRERKAGRLASLDRLTASEIIWDLIAEGKIRPGLHGDAETAAALEGLAMWLEAELAAGQPPKHLVQVAANAAVVLAGRIRDREDCWLERRAPGPGLVTRVPPAAGTGQHGPGAQRKNGPGLPIP